MRMIHDDGRQISPPDDGTISGCSVRFFEHLLDSYVEETQGGDSEVSSDQGRLTEQHLAACTTCNAVWLGKVTRFRLARLRRRTDINEIE